MHILNHRVYGTGSRAIYIMHGIFGMLDNWHYVAGILGETHTVVTSDARNHGKSFHTPDMGFDTMAEDLARLMDHLGHKEAVVIGHSMGGKTAMKFAEMFPQRVSHLVVVDIANKNYPPGHIPYFQAFKSIDFSSIASRAEAEAAFLPYAPDLGVRQFLLKNLEPAPGGGYRPKSNIPAIEAHYQKIIAATPLQCPAFLGNTLFVAGEKSGYIKPEDETDLLQYFPSAGFVTVPAAGHWVHADNPKSFIEVLNQEVGL